jgi:hypothetical protein
VLIRDYESWEARALWSAVRGLHLQRVEGNGIRASDQERPRGTLTAFRSLNRQPPLCHRLTRLYRYTETLNKVPVDLEVSTVFYHLISLVASPFVRSIVGRVFRKNTFPEFLRPVDRVICITLNIRI